MTVEYHRPASLAEALDLMASRPLTVIAGGTDVYPARTARRAWGIPVAGPVLDISAISDLRGLERSGAVWRIGAGTTWSALARHASLPSQFNALRRAALDVGGVQVQNRGTVVGNVITASPAGDGIPNLLALEAAVEVVSLRGRRTLPIHAFVAGYRRTALAPDELVTALVIPARDSAASAFRKLGARRYLVISIAMTAIVANVDGDRLSGVRIAVGACSERAMRLSALEDELEGVRTREAPEIVSAAHFAGLSPIDDIRASAAYRLAAAETLVRDALSDLARAPPDAPP